MPKPNCITRLVSAGISFNDARELRRIYMALSRWHELECGSDAGSIERDETTGKTFWRDPMTGKKSPTADRETGALMRLTETMKKYPTLGFFVQSDPRGHALYILRPGDVPTGADADASYSNGIAVFK
ncbi:hypothetical protein [Bradyrhizobium sp. S3.9.1]|uniref:hypothetical protein n=1 Tax=Bradyrhizobium sp. S3.9.1 TaxID=3156431 RepID=UPI003398238A